MYKYEIEKEEKKKLMETLKNLDDLMDKVQTKYIKLGKVKIKDMDEETKDDYFLSLKTMMRSLVEFVKEVKYLRFSFGCESEEKKDGGDSTKA